MTLPIPPVHRPRMLRTIAAGLTALIAGCASDVFTDPDSIRIDPTRLVHLRAPQAIKVSNAFESEVKREFPWTNNTVRVIDFKKLTDNAIQVLTQALQQRGITRSATAGKAISLRVHPNVRVEIIGGIARVWLQLHAELADGSLAIVDAAASTGFGPEHAFSAAIEFALNALLIEPKVVAYLNS